jgi:ABC-type uncharacterized transport system ATPase subunit
VTLTTPVIQVSDVVKDFSRAICEPGLAGSVRALVSREQVVSRAVDDNQRRLRSQGD